MNVSETISMLSKQDLLATCQHCAEKFSLGESYLFDGTVEPPEKISDILEAQILQAKKELSAKQGDADTAVKHRANISKTTKLGKGLETILYAHRNFNMNSYDFRFLANPIDLVIFRGLSKGKLESLTFVDVKTGKSRLKQGQRSIKNAVNDKNVHWREI